MKYIFENRHIGINDDSKKKMLAAIGVSSVQDLIDKTIPADIHHKDELAVSEAMSESEYLAHIKSIAQQNKMFKNYIGLGYYGTFTPSVILRNIFENPGWYTAYTPYQAEISQGRLEALLNFQTMVLDLTKMELANASLLDEATAGAEAMIMFYNSRKRAQVKAGVNKFFASEDVFPQTKAVLENRAESLNIDLIFGDEDEFVANEEFFGALIQYPGGSGEVKNIEPFIQKLAELNIPVAVGADLLSLAVLKAPGDMGADVVYGTTQRFGIPLGYGGPHAAYFATKETYKRNIPGRIIGVSQDTHGKTGLRMALQTREQHIKREKATSNICTAQALLAIMAGMYGAYHGPQGIRAIAEEINGKANLLAASLIEAGIEVYSETFFDTIRIDNPKNMENIKTELEGAEINLFYGADFIQIAIDETSSIEDLETIAKAFGAELSDNAGNNIPTDLSREVDYLSHPVFNSYHSESEMMRYMKRLENKDLSLVHSMISLGSCTMKLNAASEMIPVSWPEFANIHPFAPVDQAKGYLAMIEELGKDLKEITRFDAISFQPNSGAQGEYAGLATIKAYHEANGDHHRNIAIIPSSAHGTNPASAVMAGMKVVVVQCDEQGNIDVSDLKEKVETHKENLSTLMITYPSTHGVYEEGVKEITQLIHDNGGQVYMDGANMNAQVGITSPGEIGADVCHLNLHKTFAIPHGGGGPGMGPIGVAKHLAPFLPKHPLVETGGDKGIKALAAAPFSSASILLISYGYVKMLGGKGLKASTEAAILNANYIKSRVENHFNVLYTGKNGTVAHEMILDCRPFKEDAKIDVTDIAKRLMDYGFHAPTMSFPVAGTIMVEPTESESIEELDRFCDALIEIKNEIDEVQKGIYPLEDNALVNAPHTLETIVTDNWTHAYGREKATYPLNYLRSNKFWPSVGRLDNAYGDRNLICSCPSVESYSQEELV